MELPSPLTSPTNVFKVSGQEEKIRTIYGLVSYEMLCLFIKKIIKNKSASQPPKVPQAPYTLKNC